MTRKSFLLFLLVTTLLQVFNFAHADNFIVLDVRTPAEYNESHIKDAVNIDVLNPTFEREVAKLDKNKSYKLYCRSGNRSAKALKQMESMGFKQLENLGSLSEAAAKLKASCVGKGPC